MSAKEESREGPQPLADALDDYSAEGAEILYSEPAPLIRASIYLIVALVIVGVIWSFIGEADVIVSARGFVAPEDEVRRVYAPAAGELEKILVRAGEPVAEFEELARISSVDAIRRAASAREAELNLEGVELKRSQLEAELSLMTQKIQQLELRIEAQRGQLHRYSDEVLGQQQRRELAEAQTAERKALTRRDEAGEFYGRYKGLDDGTVPQVDIDRARVAVQQATADYGQAEQNLAALESRFIEQSARKEFELADLQAGLQQSRIELAAEQLKMEQAPRQLEIDLDRAQAEADAARQIRFENSAGGNVLVVLSPVSGVVTQVAFSQPGDKVQANTPLVSIAPEGSRKILKVQIAERDRGFLEEGQDVKMKFAAFPYQRYGFIRGKLDFISPTTSQPAPGAQPVYEGHVALEAEHVDAQGEQRPIRYGMSAVAEVVVRKRRLIDMALDPLSGA